MNKKLSLLIFVSLILLLSSVVVGCGSAGNDNESADEPTEQSTGSVEKTVEPTREPLPQEPTIDAATSETVPENDPTEVMVEATTETIPEEETTVEQQPELTPEPTVEKDPPKALMMTWWECRRKQASLTKEEADYCDKKYIKPQQEYKYNIRWVFLYDAPNATTWVKSRLDILNERFKRSKITFQTHSITQLKQTVLANKGEYDNRKRFKFQQLKYELIQLLKLKSTVSNAAALQALKQQLLSVGVTSSLVQSLTLNTNLAPNAFLNIVARALEREVHVYIAKKLITNTGGTPGGYASLPTYNHSNRGRGSIYLKESYRADAVAHEVGHYFGLVHTQATQETLRLQDSYPTGCKTFLPQGTASLKATLQRHLGSNYKKALGQPYVSYNGSTQDLTDFRALRCAIGRLWVSRINTFQKPKENDETTWKGFANMGEFLTHIMGNGKAYEKLYSTVVNGKTRFNCSFGASRKIECVYGTKKFLGSTPLLLDSIAFEKGEVSNLMSYLNNAKNFPKRVLATAQDEMMQLHARTAERLALWNVLTNP